MTPDQSAIAKYLRTYAEYHRTAAALIDAYSRPGFLFVAEVLEFAATQVEAGPPYHAPGAEHARKRYG